MQKISKRIMAIGMPLTVVAVTGVAVATGSSWHAGGTGTGYAKAGNASSALTTNVLSISTGDLVPGGTGAMQVTVKAPTYGVQFDTMSFAAPSTSQTACTGSPVTLTTTGVTATVGGISAAGTYDGTTHTFTFTTPVHIDGGSTAAVVLSGLAQMASDAVDGCQNAPFTSAVTLGSSS